MPEDQIFEYLFKVAETSQDPEGVVAACLVLNGKVLVASGSADDGVRHAEDLVIEKAGQKDISITDDMVLYTTLEPCSFRSPENQVDDCTTIIINAGIKNIVFAANDPEYSKEARTRCETKGINYKQIDNPEIIQKSADIFNSTISKSLSEMQLPRQEKL